MVIFAIWLRLSHLSKRPMHTDEAVHAVKFGALLEENSYQYDRFEYHGPTLYYLSLIPAWFAGVEKIDQVSEYMLRLVPVCLGVMMIMGTLLMRRGLGWPITLIAAFLMSISPAMVYYSRYYIHEMLLVAFTSGVIVTGICYAYSRSIGWAIGCGVMLGLMHTTKETFVLSLASLIVALFVTLLTGTSKRIKSWLHEIRISHLGLAVMAGLIVSTLFFSSFFQHPPGLIDSFLTYKTYSARAIDLEIHQHPWYQYFYWLFLESITKGPWWTEIYIGAFSLVGIFAGFRLIKPLNVNLNVFRFLWIYTIVLTFLYTIIPYKTPWSMLGFWYGWILMAAYALYGVWVRLSNRWYKIGFVFLTLFGVGHLLCQSILLNEKYYADAKHPYVYAHPSASLPGSIEEAEKYLMAVPDHTPVVMEVIAHKHQYWPLPWYFRHYPNIAWYDSVPTKGTSAPVVLAPPDQERILLQKWYEAPPPGKRFLYIPFKLPVSLHPGNVLNGYVRMDIWEKVRQSKHINILSGSRSL
jgi:uncharacterized protein (TIGR03663 family)